MNAHEREGRVFFHTYKRIPIEIDRGEGEYLFGKDGTRYLDMFGGLAVNALGYAHPRLLKAIGEQSRRYIHLSNYYLQEPQILLAEKLVAHTGCKRVFFTNSGTEAIEGALKVARQWGSKRGRAEVVSFSNAFHGRTMGALSLMDRPHYRDGFGPFLDRCRVAEFNNPEALREAAGRNTAAVILEYIQGEGGICPVTTSFAAALNDLRKELGFLLIADEIQSGVGRTGRFFGYRHFDAEPDITVVAKPLGGGLPLGAILGNEQVADVLDYGMHGTTFGGNPVACAAGLVVLEEIVEKGLMQNAERMGKLLLSKLEELRRDFPGIVREARGYGLMVGMELDRDAEPYVLAMRKRNILVNATAKTVLRFLPPLTVTAAQVEETAAALRDSLLRP